MGPNTLKKVEIYLEQAGVALTHVTCICDVPGFNLD